MSLSPKKLKVLVTNDDGIDGEGLKVLVDSLKDAADVYVLAPDSNRSAVSSRITMWNNLTLTKHKEQVFSCSGMPVDCVICAVKSSLFGVKFDAVVSGVNAGANVGTDVVYSGTCAAARQAVIMGIPGIAVSLEYSDEEKKEFNFKPLADFTANNLNELISLCDGEVFVSLNATSADSYKEAVFASGCKRYYDDRFLIEPSGDSSFSAKFSSGKMTVTGAVDSDFNISDSGKIAVSLIYAEPAIKKTDKTVKFRF